VDGFLILYKPFSENDDPDGGYQRYNVSNARLRRAEISGLHPDTSYSFRMQCYNSAGQSDMSNAFVQKTLGTILLFIIRTNLSDCSRIMVLID